MQIKNIEWFKNLCEKNSFHLSDLQLQLMQKYVVLLLKKNKEVNLISKNSEDLIWEEHILHSISFLFFNRLNPKTHLLDLGTGGGLPGILIKILYPDLKVTLLDSTQKKIVAVNEILQNLEISDIKGISGRAEEINNTPEYKNKYDYVIARAVSTLKNLVAWSIPFLKLQEYSEVENFGFIPLGSLIVLKGGNIEQEISEIQKNKKVKNIEIRNIVYSGCDTLRNPDKKVVVIRF